MSAAIGGWNDPEHRFDRSGLDARAERWQNEGMNVSDFARTIKENILRVLAEQGVSKNELARRAGIESGNLCRLLNTDKEIQSDTIQKIADALGIKSSDLAIEHEHAA